MDWAEDHTYCENVARKIGVAEDLIIGNKWAVPGIQELVELIVKHLTRYESHKTEGTPGIPTETATIESNGRTRLIN